MHKVYTEEHLCKGHALSNEDTVCCSYFTDMQIKLPLKYCKNTSLQDIQWNLSTVDTIGTQLAVLYKEEYTTLCSLLGHQTVSSLERCPLFRVSFIERFHCIPTGVGNVEVPHCI